MSGSVQAQLMSNVIHVRWRGTIDESILVEGQQQILDLLTHSDQARILHDTLEMEDPTTKLALMMRSFDMQIKDRVSGIATVVKSPKTAVMAKISFVFSRKHQVFRNDTASAIHWLKSL